MTEIDASDILQFHLVNGTWCVTVPSMLSLLGTVSRLPDAPPIGQATLEVMGEILTETLLEHRG